MRGEWRQILHYIDAENSGGGSVRRRDNFTLIRVQMH